VTAAEIRAELRALRAAVAKLPFDATPAIDPSVAARAKACAITKIDEALLWLLAYEHGGA
jgi:hypothetical protein